MIRNNQFHSNFECLCKSGVREPQEDPGITAYDSFICLHDCLSILLVLSDSGFDTSENTWSTKFTGNIIGF